MLRFEPTASGNGELHIGHFANLCLIQYISEEKGVPAGYIVDDLQITNDWNENSISESNAKSNAINIQNTIAQLFPEMKDLGRFSDETYIKKMTEFYVFYEEKKCFEFNNMIYGIPNIAYRKSSNGYPIFDVLKCFYKKKDKPRSSYAFSPYYAHEVIDVFIGTTWQIVDSSLYDSYSYKLDNHIPSFNYYQFWSEILGRKPYGIILHPRLVDYNGNEISKSNGNNLYSIDPLDTFEERAASAFRMKKIDRRKIAEKLLNAKSMNPIRLADVK